MLLKILKIRRLGLVFSSFDWIAETPSFKPVNIVYGYNGCGKTTLTRLFRKIGNRDSPLDIDYELETDDGAKFDESSEFPFPIRIFNSDYVADNVRLIDHQANAISVLLGAENKKLAAEIEADELYLNGDPKDSGKPGAIYELDGKTKKRQRLERENDAAFTSVAKTIGAVIGGAALRTYRSPQAKVDFAKITSPSILTTEELDIHIGTLKQEMLGVNGEVAPAHLNSGGPALAGLLDMASDGAVLCMETATSSVIDRLKKNPDIAIWVEQGRALHAKHGSERCEYCTNQISDERVAELSAHFSDADRALKSRIDLVLDGLRDAWAKIHDMEFPDPLRMYGELRQPYQDQLDELKKKRSALLEEVTSFGKVLQQKKLNTTETLESAIVLDIVPLQRAINQINAVIGKHNDKSDAFRLRQSDAAEKIKVHYLSLIYSDIHARREQDSKLQIETAALVEAVGKARKRIEMAKAAISSAHKGCEEINSGLRAFLGRDEFRFEPELKLLEDGQGEQVIGYKIVRGDKPATHLSEGEKTAIAFIYFVVHLSDGQFNKANGLVIIDDPISSLDSNSLYQAFSFLKSAVSGCRQVFVFTHNFDFLKLLLNWRSKARRPKTGLYMIRNYFVGDERRAVIDVMERELRDYESEYHYLFKTLKEMRRDQNGTIMRAYPVPNIARKVWETFLLYCVPTGESSYEKMERLKRGYDPEALDAIYKFTNDNSHVTGAGFNPALVPETRNVLGQLFEIMKAVAPAHFELLDGATPLS